jgi:hypothetical protein
VFSKRENPLERFVAIAAGIVVHGHRTPPEVIQRNSTAA